MFQKGSVVTVSAVSTSVFLIYKKFVTNATHAEERL